MEERDFEPREHGFQLRQHGCHLGQARRGHARNIGDKLPGNASCTWPLILDTNTYLVGCSYTGEGIYRTTDAGQNWSSVSATGGSNAPLKAADGSIYWAIRGGGGLLRSTDKGQPGRWPRDLAS
jgi:photosystem II stability/assembly factor-like uncharacterized protein